MKDLAVLYAFGKMDAFKKVFDIADYKKKELPRILAMKNGIEGSLDANDITFSEVGKVSDEEVPVE